MFSKACSNRDLGSTTCQVIKSNATACVSQRGDVSYLILRELNKGSLTLSTEGLAYCSAPWGWETRENGLHFRESPFRASWMARKDTTLAPQSLPMAESLPSSRRDFISESWFASACKLQNKKKKKKLSCNLFLPAWKKPSHPRWPLACPYYSRSSSFCSLNRCPPDIVPFILKEVKT